MSQLACPHCGTTCVKERRRARLMEPLSGEPMDVLVDVCPQGHGKWCDKMEAEALVGVSQEFTLLVEAMAVEPGCHACDLSVPEGVEACPECGASVAINCPSCDKVLLALRIGGVTLDYCPGGHGLWLDAHELDRLKAHFAGHLSRSTSKGLVFNCWRCPKTEVPAEQAFLAEEGILCSDCLSLGFVAQINALRPSRRKRRVRRGFHDQLGHYGTPMGGGGRFLLIGGLDGYV